MAVDRMYVRVPVGAMLRRVAAIDEAGKLDGKKEDERDAELGRWARMVAMCMATGMLDGGMDAFLGEVLEFTDNPRFAGRPKSRRSARKKKEDGNGDD